MLSSVRHAQICAVFRAFCCQKGREKREGEREDRGRRGECSM